MANYTYYMVHGAFINFKFFSNCPFPTRIGMNIYYVPTTNSTISMDLTEISTMEWKDLPAFASGDQPCAHFKRYVNLKKLVPFGQRFNSTEFRGTATTSPTSQIFVKFTLQEPVNHVSNMSFTQFGNVKTLCRFYGDDIAV